jgi:hypothetical protein
MAKIRRTSDLIPGRYFVGFAASGDKQYHDLSADDLRKYVDGTNRLIAKGYEPPFLLEHAPPNSAEGSPVNKTAWDEKANKVRNGAGWIKKALISDKGELGYELDVRDKQVAKGLADGSIKFTSPELRKEFTTGDGEVIPYVIAHTAATHTPRNPRQSETETIAMALQFSMDDLEEKEDETPEVTDVDKDGNPEVDGEEIPAEVVEEATPDVIDMKVHKTVYDTLVGMLKNKGMSLPDEVTPENLFSAMIAAMSGVEQAPEENQIIEESQPVQYSLDSLNDETPKLLAKAIRTECDAIKQGIKGLRIPALQKSLAKLTATMQFSADADEVPTLTVKQVLAALNEGLPQALGKLLTCEGQQFSLAEHPNSEFLTGGVMTVEQAKQYVDKQAESVPLLRG